MVKATNLVVFSTVNLLKLTLDHVKCLWNGMNNILCYVAIIHRWDGNMVGMKLSGYVQILLYCMWLYLEYVAVRVVFELVKISART